MINSILIIDDDNYKKKTSKMIDEECKSKFDNYIGIVIYSSVNNEWKEKLVKMIGDIKNDNNTVC